MLRSLVPVVFGIGIGIGCGAVGPPAAPPREPTNLIDAEAFATKIAGLRATLARHRVEIDTAPVIDSCAADAYRDSLKNRCVRCEVATRANTGGVDPELIDGVAIAFALYPPALLAATKLEHVALCRTIRIQGEPDERAPAGVAILDQHRVLISVEQFVEGAPLYQDFTIEQVVHHEVFHLFDHATSGERAYDDREWHALNPAGFEYRDPAVRDEQRPAGFVNTYGTTNELEDRATVFEYLLGQPTRLCEIAHLDPAVAAKTTTVWKRIARVTGDKLLRQHAPCVDWIGKPPSRRPAKRPAKRPVKLPRLR
ncbi:MAG: hypothetical protein IPQ07_25040 [Myxococcales bacterium]|nr:hypothetical protein [Myxococcales bacterium]